MAGSALLATALAAGITVAGASGVFSGAGSAQPAPAIGAGSAVQAAGAAQPAALNFAAQTYDFPAKADLDGREGPGKSSKTLKVNAYQAGQNVPVVCQVEGEEAYGSTLWDKTADGYFVTDAYVKTGSDGRAAGVPDCGATGAAGAKSFLAKADLDGREGPSKSSKTLKVNAYQAGQNVPVVCQVEGEEAYGSTLWDKTADGYFVTDAYVKTGSDGRAAGVPDCGGGNGTPPAPPAPPAPPVGGGATNIPGIDISSHNADVDLKKEFQAGTRFVITKATEGSTYKSPPFAAQNQRAIDAGMIHGAYHFANPAGASGAAQANYFVDNGGGWSDDGRTLPGALDIEWPVEKGVPECYGLSQQQMRSWIADFLATYKKRTGRDALIYTAVNWWKPCTGDTADFAGNPLWLVKVQNQSWTSLAGGKWPATILQTKLGENEPDGLDRDVFTGSEKQLKSLAAGKEIMPEVKGSIGEKYNELGGSKGFLGAPLDVEFCGLRDGGCGQHFERGSIYWSPATGAHFTRGVIRDKWASLGWEKAQIGYPITDEICGIKDGGCFQRFQFENGHIYWTLPTGAWKVQGEIFKAYAAADWEKGKYGYPVGDEYRNGNAWEQKFTGGVIRLDDPAPPTAGCDRLNNPRSCAEAVEWAKARVGQVDRGQYYRKCDNIVARAYGFTASGSYTAVSHWKSIPAQYKNPGNRDVPVGALAFFNSSSAGHVMISIGDGKFVSNDIDGPGKLSITTIADIENRWGQQYFGWAQPWFQINH
ncbi:GH25 family lysozyme [Nakamurella aerolata]|uniref:GH25 family lysozyme n=1 Tax=Nakamurella aerolata TaxID=1656892 RepID=UPI001BB211CE